jgi:hypothetical protein
MAAFRWSGRSSDVLLIITVSWLGRGAGREVEGGMRSKPVG